MKDKKISIIIPAYNEEKRIGKTLKLYHDYFSERKKNKEIKDFEIVVVLNACIDKTLEVVMQCQENCKTITYLDFKRGGKGFAIIKGFKDSLNRDNDLIGFVDADLATLPDAFFDLVRNIDGYGGIIASRWLKKSKIKKQSFKRIVLSRGFNFIVKSLFFMNYKDTQCGAKLFQRKVVEDVVDELKLTEWAFDINLLYLTKRRVSKVKEHPTTWEERGESKIKPKTPILMFLAVIHLRIIYSPFERYLRPLRFVSQGLHRLLNKQ